MRNGKMPFLFKLAVTVLAVWVLAVPVWAELDPDPNSPTPVLISEADSTRALAAALSSTDEEAQQFQSNVFRLNTKVVIYLTNIALMEGEGAAAFRLEVEDAKGRNYRFPVLDVRPLEGREWVYAATVMLRDELGFWEPPAEDGDVLIRLTWRGLASNPVKIALGKPGGGLKEPEDAVPTPMKAFLSKPEPQSDRDTNYVGYRYSGDRIRFLEQAAFGPTTALDQRIRRIGLRTWLAEQFEAQYPSALNPYPDIPLKSGDNTVGCPTTLPTEERRVCLRDHYTLYPLQSWFFKDAFYGDAQLKHKVAWALSQIWVTSGVDIQQSSHMIAYHKILSNNAFGNYRNLMREMTLNPAMGDYLDMARSTRTNPNENYPREILQLFALGLFQLDEQGRVRLDGNNQPVPTYDQTTVNNFTKVFTGWTFCNNGANPACPNAVVGTVNFKDPMLLNQANHDVTAKTLFTAHPIYYPNPVNPTLPPNQNGMTDLDQALDNIFYHPTLPPFVSKLLIQHLVTSDPSPAYVGRVTAVFKDNGLGVRGDLKAVVRAILLDPEARGDAKTSPTYGKLREPVQFLTNFLRHFNVRSADGIGQSDGVVSGVVNGIGQNPFYSPTVFNYYSPDYIIPGTALIGPEFNILTTGTAIGRANVGNTFAFSRINVSADAPAGTAIDLTEMTQLSQNDPTGNQMMDALNTRLMHGTMPEAMRNTILTAVLAVPSTTPIARAQQAIYLVVTSSQFQVQR